MSGAPIQASGLVARHGPRTVVDNVSLQLLPGRLTVLVGPNGAGKSTLLRTLLGLHPVSAGSVQLFGEALSALSPREVAQRAAWVPQQHGDAGGFSVLEVVLMGRSARLGALGLTGAHDRERAMALLSELGLGAVVDRTLSTLSGGEQRLVLYARALMQEPRVLLLDEPTAFLDLHHQAMLLDRLRARARAGLAVLCVLHDLNLAAGWADEVWLMKAGALVAQGTPIDVLTRERLEALYGVPMTVSDDAGQRLFAPRPAG